jgi:glutathione S-transferase
VPYEIKLYQRGSDLRAPKELLDVHPLGKAPIITDGDITLAESGAIIRAYTAFHFRLD